jgi:hypothetical protein
VPVHVNVVPGDQVAGRVPDSVVRTELVYLRVQQAKRRASTHLSAGDSDSDLQEIRQARDELAQALPTAPPEFAADLADEQQSLHYLANETEYGTIARAAKYPSWTPRTSRASVADRDRDRTRTDTASPSVGAAATATSRDSKPGRRVPRWRPASRGTASPWNGRRQQAARGFIAGQPARRWLGRQPRRLLMPLALIFANRKDRPGSVCAATWASGSKMSSTRLPSQS